MFKWLFRSTPSSPRVPVRDVRPIPEPEPASRDNKDAAVARLKEAERVAIESDDAVSLRNILAEADTLGLEPFDFTRYHIETHLALLDFKARWTRGVSGMLEGRPVYVTFDTVRHKRRGDYGHLHALEDMLVYLGEVRIEIPWSKIIHIHVGSDDDGDTVAIQERGRRTATKFWFDERSEALILQYLITESFCQPRTD